MVRLQQPLVLIRKYLYKKFDKWFQKKLKKNFTKDTVRSYNEWFTQNMDMYWRRPKWRRKKNVIIDDMSCYKFFLKMKLEFKNSIFYFEPRFFFMYNKGLYKDIFYISGKFFFIILIVFFFFELLFNIIKHFIRDDPKNESFLKNLIWYCIDFVQGTMSAFIFFGIFVNWAEIHRHCYLIAWGYFLYVAHYLLNAFLDYTHSLTEQFDPRIAMFNHYIPMIVWTFFCYKYWMGYASHGCIEFIQVFLNGDFLLIPYRWHNEFHSYCWHRHLPMTFTDFQLKFKDFRWAYRFTFKSL